MIETSIGFVNASSDCAITSLDTPRPSPCKPPSHFSFIISSLKLSVYKSQTF